MLNKIPEQRPSADDILQHDWFKIRESHITTTPFMDAKDQEEMGRSTMGDIFNKNLTSAFTDRSESINGSLLN